MLGLPHQAACREDLVGLLRAADHVMIIAAHPDDEIIGAGGIMCRLSNVHVVHVTDGAPEDLTDARAAGFTNRHEYAAVRQREAEAALALAGVTPDRILRLTIPDQRASFALVQLSRKIAKIIRHLTPSVVITHAYEGGHPDHDATAFAVHMACHLLRRSLLHPPEIIEMAGYRMGSTGMEVGTFLGPDSGVATYHLTPWEQDLKQRMLACHATQAKTLRPFRTEAERVRRAPHYDFLAPPHDGVLFYEWFPWGINGEAWRCHARAALTDLGVPACP